MDGLDFTHFMDVGLQADLEVTVRPPLAWTADSIFSLRTGFLLDQWVGLDDAFEWELAESPSYSKAPEALHQVNETGNNNNIDVEYLDEIVEPSLQLTPASLIPNLSTTSGTPQLFSPQSNSSYGLTRYSSKRSLDDHLGISAGQVEVSGVRKKQRYESDRRQQVAIMRDVKPCLRCKRQKISCKFPGPCNACIKIAGSAILARHTCIRQTFLDLRFGGIDLLSHTFTEDLLKREIGTFEGEKRLIACNLHSGVETVTILPLWLRVQGYRTPDGSLEPLLYDYMTGQGPQGPVFKTAVSERYAVIPESLPTSQDIADWIRHAQAQNDKPGLMTCLSHFIEMYRACQPKLPLHDVLKSASTILTLLRFLRNWKITNTSTDGSQYLSRAVVAQIIVVVKDGIRASERDLLSSLHQHIYGIKGPGQKNMIPLWIALWALMTTYRNCMIYYKDFSKYRKVALEHDPADTDTLIAASKYMYDVLTCTYAALFRTSTPLYLDWRVEKSFELLGKSEDLKKAFVALKTEIWWLYNPSKRLETEDALLQSMVIDQEEKLRPRYPL